MSTDTYEKSFGYPEFLKELKLAQGSMRDTSSSDNPYNSSIIKRAELIKPCSDSNITKELKVGAETTLQSQVPTKIN